MLTPTEHQLWRLHSTFPFWQECTSVSQSCSSTPLDRTCCKRRQPPPLDIPFTGSNTMRFLSLGGSLKTVFTYHHCPCPWTNFLDRITHALQTITADMLHRVWDKFDYRVDVCRVTQGTHIEELWLTLRLLMSYVYGAPIFDVSRSHTTTHHSR